MPERASGPEWRRLPGERRLHARHGPIDLIVDASGEAACVARCERAAHAAFAPVLETLVAELPELRRVLGSRPHRLEGSVARRMLAAVAPYRASSVTPMAAVAGAVADHVLAAMLAADSPLTASVNNGGDIALHVAPGATLRVGLCVDPASGRLAGTLRVTAGSGIGGIATSGWRGRSHSLGIADAVTVLARSAAAADAAATLIANAVDLPGSPRVRRVPARELSPDSDLGARPVTVEVAPLDDAERARALAGGVRVARRALARGLVAGVRLELQGSVASVLPAAGVLSAAAPEWGQACIA